MIIQAITANEAISTISMLEVEVLPKIFLAWCGIAFNTISLEFGHKPLAAVIAKTIGINEVIARFGRIEPRGLERNYRSRRYFHRSSIPQFVHSFLTKARISLNIVVEFVPAVLLMSP